MLGDFIAFVLYFFSICIMFLCFVGMLCSTSWGNILFLMVIGLYDFLLMTYTKRHLTEKAKIL